jgi:hypothetical protein
VTLDVTNGVQTDTTNAFTIDVQGVQIPGPDLYIPADANGNDASGNGHTNPVVNLVNFPGGNGNIGGAADLAFATSYLDYGDHADYRTSGNAALTVSSTVNPRTFPVGGAPRIAEHTDGQALGLGWSFGVSTAGVPEMTVRYVTTDAVAAATTALPTSTHSQVSATWTAAGNRSDIFVEGVQEVLTSNLPGAGGVGDDTGEDLFIGNDSATMTNEWDGGIDETAVWTSAFTANQHATLGWLKLRQVTIISWANQAPTAVSYATREVTVNTPMVLAPTLPAVDPEAATVTYSIASGTLPDSVFFDSGTGVFSGTPSVAALLGGSPAGDYVLTVEGDDGVNQTESAPFLISVRGVELPDPVSYGPMDTSGVDPVTGLFPTNTNVTFPGANGNVAGAADFAAADSSLDYGANAAFQVSGKSALTAVATVNPRAFPNSGPRIFDHSDGNGWILLTNTSGNLVAVVAYSTTTAAAASTATLPTGTQTTVGMTWTSASDRIDLFIGGVAASLSVDDAGVGTLNDDSAVTLTIGNFVTPTRHWDGTLDEMALFDAEFTAEQHATIAWLAARQESLASWIRDEVPVGPTYNTQQLESGAAASFLPVAEGYDPEGQPTQFLAATGLPSGLSLNTTTGEISGTPTGIGGYTAAVDITDGMHIATGPSFAVDMQFGAASVSDGFEVADSWPGTITNPYPDTPFATSSVADSFDNLDGWPGT